MLYLNQLTQLLHFSLLVSNKQNQCVSLRVCVDSQRDVTGAASLCKISLLYCLDPSHREQSIHTHWFCLVFISACKWLPINNSSQIYLISFKGRGFTVLTGLAGKQQYRWNVGTEENRCALYSASLIGNSSSGCQCARNGVNAWISPCRD